MSETCEEFIVEELSKSGIEYGYTKNDIVVSCPFHDHSGTKKKLGFKRSSQNGAMYCFVCKAKGSWNDYAEAMGLQTIIKTRYKGDLNSLLNQYKRESVEPKERRPILPKQTFPWVGQWRELSEEFLQEIPSFKWYDTQSRGYRILWPVIQNKVVKGFTSYAIDERTWPKTRNLSGLPMNKCLFPIDHDLIDDKVVLVEGQYDALRLLSVGIPAVAILGVNQWDSEGKSGRTKTRLLVWKGIKRIIIAMDGDDAGYNCAKEINRSFSRIAGIDVRFMDFPDPPKETGLDKYDPGNCPNKYLNVIRKMLK